MPTTSIKEVARHAGVSVGTVSNVLNRPDDVAPATRRRVLESIAELGYVRNDSARQLRAGHSRMVAVIVLDVANPFFTDVVRGAESTVEEAGSTVIVCDSSEDPTRERRHLDMLDEQRVRGILITPVNDDSNDRIERLVGRGIPVVLVDRGAGHHQRCAVSVDDVNGGRLAGEHLLSAGHRSVAFVGGPDGIQQVADRHRGIGEVTGEAGAELTVVPTASLTIAEGRAAADRIAESGVTAVFCANDLLALGLLQGLTMRGLHVPGDIAILGYDDIEFAAAAAVPLSSIRQPREQLGRAAAELLVAEIADGPAHRHRHVVFQPELVVRQSTGG